MKIVIVCTFDFWNQDHLWIAKDAYNKLKDNKHTVDLIQIPFKNDSLSFFEQVLAYRSFDLNVADTVITFGPFAHVIEHRKKIAFITNHLKGYYELWNSPYGELATEANAVLKDKIHHLDNMTLSESKKNFCFYENIRKRFFDLAVDVLPMPRVSPLSAIKSKNRNTIVSLGTFDSDYRFDLLVNSLAFCETSNLRMIIAAKKKRIDIYDALCKTGKKWLDDGILELVETLNSDIDGQILSKADLFVDAGTESDVLSPSVFEGLRHQKSLAGIQGCGFFEKTTFANSGEFIFSSNPKELGTRIDQFFKISSDDRLKTLYSAYDRNSTLDWETVIS